MDNLRLCDSEYRFMSLVWENSPINSGELVKLCAAELGWKKSTTYTVIKKLCGRGFIKNENALVTVLVPMERVQTDETEFFVDRTFGGSLSGLVAAFLGSRKLSEKEAEKLKRLIEESEAETNDK